MNKLKLLLLASVCLFLFGFSCGEPEIRNGGGKCQECEIVVNFDRSLCTGTIEKVFSITVNDGVRRQSWINTHSNYPGGGKSFEIECNKKVTVTYILECQYENGNVTQISDVRTYYPQSCIEQVYMMPQRNY